MLPLSWRHYFSPDRQAKFVGPFRHPVPLGVFPPGLEALVQSPGPPFWDTLGTDRIRLSSRWSNPVSRLLSTIADERDVAAFNLLYKKYDWRLRRFLIMRGSSREEAEDISQLTLLTIWCKAGLYDRDTLADRVDEDHDADGKLPKATTLDVLAKGQPSPVARRRMAAKNPVIAMTASRRVTAHLAHEAMATAVTHDLSHGRDRSRKLQPRSTGAVDFRNCTA
jgi:hypothetical protein